MTVKVATTADVRILAALHAQCFDDAWDADAIRKVMDSPSVLALAMGHEAFILVRTAGGEAEILTLATAPHARRRGHARALVLAAAGAVGHEAAEMFLEVAQDNAAALALYSGLGFVAVGLRPGYYRRPSGAADAVTLRAALPPSTGRT